MPHMGATPTPTPTPTPLHPLSPTFFFFFSSAKADPCFSISLEFRREQNDLERKYSISVRCNAVPGGIRLGQLSSTAHVPIDTPTHIILTYGHTPKQVRTRIR